MPPVTLAVLALIVMLLIVPLLMPVVVYGSGWEGNPLVALAVGNVYHATAVLVGVVGALGWRARIRRRAGCA